MLKTINRLRPGGEWRECSDTTDFWALIRPDVRFGSKADMCSALAHVR